MSQSKARSKARSKPTGQEPLTLEQAEREARFFQLLSSEARVRILDILKAKGPTAVGEVAEVLGLSGSAASQHLNQLRLAGLVETTREAQWIRYHLTPVGQEIDLRQAPEKAGVMFR